MNAKFVFSFAVVLLIAGAMAEDRTISENYTLTADEVVDGTLTIASGVNVNLNGHSLMVSGLAGSGGIMSSVLPSGYVELEYVEATGEQYIDTGYTPTDAAKVETDIAYTGSTGSGVYRAVLAASDSNAYVHFGLWVWPNSGSKWTVTYAGKSSCYASTSVTAGTKYKIVAAWNSGAQSVSVNGTSRNTTLTSTISISHTMYLPARNNNGSVGGAMSCKIYGLKLYKPQSTLVRNYVPAKRSSDNAIGLYDLVTDTFFPSESSTAFDEGPEVGAGGGELQLNVASGVTAVNSTVAISNAVKVVKLGAGTYTSSKTQTYTGGTVVTNGYVRSTVSLGFGARGSTVDVSGARVIIDGRNATLDGYDVTIADNGVGEVLQGNTKISGAYQYSFLKSLTLSGDASISSWGEDAFGLTYKYSEIQPFTLTLNGHTLTITGNSRLCANQVTVPDEGTIVVERSAGTTYTDLYPRGTFNAPLVTLDVRSNAKIYGGGRRLCSQQLGIRGHRRVAVHYGSRNVYTKGHIVSSSDCAWR